MRPKNLSGVGMVGWQFQAFDVVEVWQNVQRAVDHARSGQGPVILEGVTYRYRGHSMSDPAKYRKDGELDAFRARDGIQAAEQRLRDLGVGDDTFAALQAEVEVEAQDAYDFAEASPIPDPDALYDYTYTPTIDGGR